MRIGLDIHGVIDKYSDIFRNFSKHLHSRGHEIHIITGQEWDKVKVKVESAGVEYDHHFSIVDYHLSMGTKMHLDEKGTWWMDETVWLRSKGDYIHRMHIDVHFDDSHEYANWVPDSCTFILVPKVGFDRSVASLGLQLFIPEPLSALPELPSTI